MHHRLRRGIPRAKPCRRWGQPPTPRLQVRVVASQVSTLWLHTHTHLTPSKNKYMCHRSRVESLCALTHRKRFDLSYGDAVSVRHRTDSFSTFYSRRRTQHLLPPVIRNTASRTARSALSPPPSDACVCCSLPSRRAPLSPPHSLPDEKRPRHTHTHNPPSHKRLCLRRAVSPLPRSGLQTLVQRSPLSVNEKFRAAPPVMRRGRHRDAVVMLS